MVKWDWKTYLSDKKATVRINMLLLNNLLFNNLNKKLLKWHLNNKQ